MRVTQFALALLLPALLAGCQGDEALPDVTADSASSPASESARAKFEPVDGVLVFVGQDNASVGGNAPHQDGYVDHIGVPAGITHYVYFAEGVENNFGYAFDIGTIDGLDKETTWAAGPMCMRCYLESEPLAGTVVHLSISMEFGSEERVAGGDYDHLIRELANFLEEFSHVPFLIRIGYEFDGPWNGYDPESFQIAWRRIVDGLRKAGPDNFATVMASSSMSTPREVWDSYYPGDDYVDWLGYSYWSNVANDENVLALAREKSKPVMIAETTPRGFFLGQLGGLVWWDWFAVLFDHIEANADVIKAVSYINADWDSQEMWTGWGDSRIQVNAEVRSLWLEKMAEPLYLHGTDGTYDAIGFASTALE